MPEAARRVADLKKSSPRARRSSPHPYNCTRGRFYLENFFRLSRHSRLTARALERQMLEKDCARRRSRRSASRCIEYLYGDFVRRSGRQEHDSERSTGRIPGENSGHRAAMRNEPPRDRKFQASRSLSEIPIRHELATIARSRSGFVSLLVKLCLARAARSSMGDIFAHTELMAAPVFEADTTASEKTRPNLKVQDGCNNRCSFCVIPLRSREEAGR